MPKNVCQNCGHKNKPADMICANCGTIIETPSMSSSASVSSNSFENKQPASSDNDVSNSFNSEATTQAATTGETLTVRSKNTAYRYIPMAITLGIVAVYYYVSTITTLPPYAFFPVLFLIFAVSSATRRFSMPMKFNQTGFVVPNNGSPVEVRYSNINNAVVRVISRGEQVVTLSLLQSEGDVSLKFDQVFPMRQFLAQLQRRRIPIKMDNGAGI